MAHNNRIRLPGTWTQGSVILPAEMEALDEAQYRAIHEGGGTWASTSQIVLGGQGMRVTGPLVADNLSGSVNSGNTLAVDTNATLSVKGVVDVLPGGSQKIEAGGSLRVLGAVGIPGRLRVENLGLLSVENGGTANVLQGAIMNLLGTQVIQPSGKLIASSGGSIEIQTLNGLVVKTGYSAKVEAGAGLDIFGSVTTDAASSVTFGGGFISTGSAVFQNFTTVTAAGILRILGQGRIEGPGFFRVIGTPGNMARVFIDTFGELSFPGGPNGGVISGFPHVTGPIRFDAVATFNATAAINAGNALRITDSAFLQVDNGTVTIASGATVLVASHVTFNRALIPSGPNAKVTDRPGVNGPTTNDHISMEAQDTLLVPAGLSGDIVWVVDVPSRPCKCTIISRNKAAQSHDLTIAYSSPSLGNVILCTFQHGSPGQAACTLVSDGTHVAIVGASSGPILL